MKDFKQNKAGYYYSDQCNLAEFQEIINQKLTEDMVPNAFEVNDNIPIYDIFAPLSISVSPRGSPKRNT